MPTQVPTMGTKVVAQVAKSADLMVRLLGAAAWCHLRVSRRMLAPQVAFRLTTRSQP